MKEYDRRYFEFITAASLRSARVLLPEVKAILSPVSVVDFGCGRGAWLKVWRELGVRRYFGVDGAYIDPETLLVNPVYFEPEDLTLPVNLERKFDLVQSLEVGEHLPEPAADTLVQTCARHGDAVLFSAAVPGQGGYRHLNEQPYTYWRDRFGQAGYDLYDCLRTRVLGKPGIDPWYAYNVFLYLTPEAADKLPREVTATRIGAGQPIPDLSPPLFRLRKACLRPLPGPLVNALHHVKKRLWLLGARKGEGRGKGK